MDWAERKQGEELAPVSKTALYNRVPNYILLLAYFIAMHFSAEHLLCAAQISTWVIDDCFLTANSLSRSTTFSTANRR